MDIHVSLNSLAARQPTPNNLRGLTEKAALLAGRLIGTFKQMSEQADTFRLADAEAVVEKLLYAYPSDVEWMLHRHRYEGAEPLRDFNAVLKFALRDLRDTGSWTVSFDLLLAADITASRDVIFRTRAEIALDARDEQGLRGLASALDAHLSAAARARLQLRLDDNREREILECIDVGET